MRTALFISILVASLSLTAQSSFPYKFNKNTRMLTFFGASTQMGALLLPDPKLSELELTQLDRNDVFKLDRPATYQWSPEAAELSDGTLAILGLLPGGISLELTLKNEWNNAFTYGIMYTETLLITNGVKDLTKDLVRRTRPMFYNDNLSFDERISLANEGDARTSFYSGHTALAFASAAFLSSTHQTLYDAPIRSTALWVSSITLASTTGYLRYKAGKHFPTDILAGAFIGTSMGILIPRLHLKNEQWSFFPIKNGLFLSYSF